MNALANMVPSFTAQAFGGDMANQTLQAKLRGLSPNHTLVLVNGKRRHTTSSLAILGGPYQGGAGVDLNFVPVDAIDHVEVLTEGAAAQYGTDAIAGVINIILKKNPDGRFGEHVAGRALRRRRRDRCLLGQHRLRSDQRFVHQSSPPSIASTSTPIAATSTRASWIRARIDPDAGGTFPNTNMPFAPGYPYLNQIFGDAAYEIKLVSVNAGVPIGDNTEFYGTVTCRRQTRGLVRELPPAEPRRRTRIRIPARSLTSVPSASVRAKKPRRPTSAGTLGVKGEMGTWNWDFASHLRRGRDRHVHARLGQRLAVANTGQTPVDFYDGTYTSTQWTTNLDLTREFEVGMAGPMNFAFGARISRGDLGSGAR